jgi:hypothetical protein
VLTVVPVQNAVLDGAFEAAGYELFDLYVCGWRVVFPGCGCLVEVLGYGCCAQSFSGEPANALEGKNGVESIREGLVLRRVRGCCAVLMLETKMKLYREYSGLTAA